MASSVSAWLDRLLDGHSLDEAQAAEVLRALAAPDTSPAMAGALLAALRAKGVVAAELRGMAGAMRALARRPRLPQGAPAVDIVGTGGDKSGSFNLSTGAALLTASCGMPVVKHGNRSVSSQSGSADVLMALGLPLPLDATQAGACLVATGFTFLFAPHYHPAMKNVAAVRQAMGVRTVFNILGPLSNPAEPAYHVIGAYQLATAELMAQALSGMPIERAFVVHGAGGWDEPTTLGPFELFDVRDGHVRRERRSPSDYGFTTGSAEELTGGDAARNAAALAAVLRGEARGAHRDALLLGTSLALEVSGQETNPLQGVARAAAAIDGGAAAKLLQRLLAFAATLERRAP